MKVVNEELHYNPSQRIGRSTFSLVFKGKFQNSTPVAVKCIIQANRRSSEIQILQNIKHKNILDLIDTYSDNLFTYIIFKYLMRTTEKSPTQYLSISHRYIVTRLCDVTLGEYLKEAYQGTQFQDAREVSFQLAKGLAHLHEETIIHGGICPDNILIYFHDEGKKIQMKLAGFGFSQIKNSNDERKEFTKADLDYCLWHKGDWMAPEIKSTTESNQSQKYYDFPMDIYCMGRVLECILKPNREKHPKKEQSNRTDLITTEEHQNPVLVSMPFAENSSALELIRSMVEILPGNRPKATEVFKHAFFEIPRLQGDEKYKLFHIKLWNF